MAKLQSRSGSPSQFPTSDSRLRDRVSTAFERLTASAPELNAVSDELAKQIRTIDSALQKLNLGISAWVEFAVQHFEDGEFMSARSIGYAKVAGTWGIAIRWNGFDPDGNPATDEWRFNDAPRSYRLEALEKLPELLEELAKTVSKTAERLKAKVVKTQQVATTISHLASATPVGRK